MILTLFLCFLSILTCVDVLHVAQNSAHIIGKGVMFFKTVSQLVSLL